MGIGALCRYDIYPLLLLSISQTSVRLQTTNTACMHYSEWTRIHFPWVLFYVTNKMDVPGLVKLVKLGYFELLC